MTAPSCCILRLYSMRPSIAISIIGILAIAAFVVLTQGAAFPNRQPATPSANNADADNTTSTPADGGTTTAVTVVADNLRIPWGIAFLPGGDILVTERPGDLLRLGDEEQKRQPVAGVRHVGEGGLLGIALHPEFQQNRWIYLYLTTEKESGLINRVERYRLRNNELTARTVIIEDIPGASYHDGGRIAFGPNNKLYVTTGDAGSSNRAQQKDSLAGKILRLNPDGSIPEGNPFGTPVYSWGHRNAQGLAWDDAGRLWATEHGRSGVRSGFDEINRIVKGENYGWPIIQGSETHSGMRSPVLQSGPTTTWAPAGAATVEDRLFFAGLRGKTLYEIPVSRSDSTDISLTEHLNDRFGRLRAVERGPDGALYITTSNTDGRGRPRQNDDKILKVAPSLLKEE